MARSRRLVFFETVFVARGIEIGDQDGY